MSWLKDILKGLDDSRVPQVAVSGTFVGVDDRSYQITVMTPGLSGTATIAWLDSEGNTDDSIVVTSGVAIPIGTDGLEIRFNFSGRLPGGLGWAIMARSDGSFDTPVLYASGELESSLAAPVRVNPETGAMVVEGFLSNTTLPALEAVDLADDIAGVAPTTFNFGGSCYGFQLTLTTTTPNYVQISFDGGLSYTRSVFQRGTLTWAPPGGYNNSVPLASIMVKGSAAGSYHVEITAWIESGVAPVMPDLVARDYAATTAGGIAETITFTELCHAYQITLLSSVLTNILISYDGGATWVRTVGPRGTYYWNPPAGYANGAPISNIQVIGEDPAESYDVEVTAWEIP